MLYCSYKEANCMKIGFTGTSHGTTSSQREAVHQVLERLDPKEFHHGDCIGADAEAHDIATKLNIPVFIHPPSDPSKRAFCGGNANPVRPYLDRNHDIVDSTELLVACPREFSEVLRSGTWATIRYAKKRQKQTLIIYPDGRLQFFVGA